MKAIKLPPLDGEQLKELNELYRTTRDVRLQRRAPIRGRHGTKPPTRDEIVTRLDVFRDKTKLFVALLDSQPILTLLCHYTPSICHLSKIGSYFKDTKNINRLCYKVAIEDACNSGCRYVDFGFTGTAGLAVFKERFRGTRVPLLVYERRYSSARALLELGPLLINNVRHDKAYAWRSRSKLWDMIFV